MNTPVEHPESYINRKKRHSIILQSVCDNNRKFTYCDVGYPGSVHDARVYRLSSLYEKINNGQLKFRDNCHMIGDAAYPISEFLLTPYRDNGMLTQRQKNYNHKFSQTRMKIERTFSKLKGRFRRLKYFDSPDLEFVAKSVMVCCVLHNIAIDHNDEYEDEFEHDDDDDQQANQVHVAAVGAAAMQRIAGLAKRDRIAARL